MAEIKEVTMDVTLGEGGDTLEGGGKRRRKTNKRAARTVAAAGGELHQQGGGGVAGIGSDSVAVEKMPHPNGQTVSVSVSVTPKPPTQTPTLTTSPTPAQLGGGGVANPKVIIAPPKKRPPKLLLVPGVKKSAANKAAALQKTFKAHRVRVMIDNTAKTQKRRRQTLQAVEAMTEEQLRAAAVSAKLSRPETVAKVPVDLLRQMLKDYRMMRGMLL